MHSDGASGSIPFRHSLLAAAIALCLGSVDDAQAQTITGATCFADSGADRALCVTMIGAMREYIQLSGKLDSSCPLNDRDDLGVTYALMDWIRARPERKAESLGTLGKEGLVEIYPCARAAIDAS
ncbi:hypothetical protein [Dongia rigui]|uniref:Rap1a immunity protein domain-containing protein n=1 Tax=Dongia rigui TaxID=940149 RepID=A0ABU5E326_9PROT|nr:hypothetical protein [Dongia rigui]MDY0874005.1 hypothetical protein [Dongia rigui]